MKIRYGLVSNSSSSSFTAIVKEDSLRTYRIRPIYRRFRHTRRKVEIMKDFVLLQPWIFKRGRKSDAGKAS